MSYPITKAQCDCKVCVVLRRVVFVTIEAPLLLPFWIVGGLFFGLASALYYGEISFYNVAREHWTNAAKTERRVA